MKYKQLSASPFPLLFTSSRQTKSPEITIKYQGFQYGWQVSKLGVKVSTNIWFDLNIARQYTSSTVVLYSYIETASEKSKKQA